MGDLTAEREVPQWLALLAPLPAEARPVRRPVLSEELKAAHSESEVSSWTSLSLHLDAPGLGLRTVLATFDGKGELVSGSDLVYRGQSGRLEQQSLGGRFEPDGSFRGTRWDGTATDPGDDPDWDFTPSPPAPGDGERLRALIEVLKAREQP